MLEMSQEGLKVKTAVESLSHRHKAVILMNIYQEMSYEEVADALKISIGTVKSRISIAKQKLKEILKENQ
jgi:RNA polymerase sigma-70 factor (ECF subfamily)